MSRRKPRVPIVRFRPDLVGQPGGAARSPAEPAAGDVTPAPLEPEPQDGPDPEQAAGGEWVDSDGRTPAERNNDLTKEANEKRTEWAPTLLMLGLLTVILTGAVAMWGASDFVAAMKENPDVAEAIGVMLLAKAVLASTLVGVGYGTMKLGERMLRPLFMDLERPPRDDGFTRGRDSAASLSDAVAEMLMSLAKKIGKKD